MDAREHLKKLVAKAREDAQESRDQAAFIDRVADRLERFLEREDEAVEKIVEALKRGTPDAFPS